MLKHTSWLSRLLAHQTLRSQVAGTPMDIATLRRAFATMLMMLTAAVAAAQPPTRIVPPEIKTIVEFGTNLSGWYSGVTTGLDTMTKIQDWLDGRHTPTEMEQQFEALNNHLDEIGIDTTNLVGNSFQGWRLAYAKTAYQQQRDALREKDPAVKRTLLDNADNNSRLAVNFALDESAFQRKLKGKSGLSYDWRVGIPHLLYIIGIRLHVMDTLLEVQGQRFMSSSQFDANLLDLRDGLLAHRARIIKGISETPGVARDLNTGLEMNNNGAVKSTAKELRDNLWSAMPLFAIQQVLDVLNLHISKEPELTSAGQVVLEDNANFCLKAATQLVPFQTPNHYVELGQCPASSPFKMNLASFEYDRGTGYLKDVSTGHCVAVDYANGWASHAYTTPCDWRDGLGRRVSNDRWTWDPIHKVLMGETGEMTVMEVIGSAFIGNQLSVQSMTVIGTNQRWVPREWSPAHGIDPGYPFLPHALADVNGDGRKDYCRFVGDAPKIYLSCDLATTGGFDSNQYTFNSVRGIDPGYDSLPRVFADVNGDGRADYCRFVGDAPKIFLSCNLATASGFDANQYTFNSITGLDQGYQSLPRSLIDVNGDGKADYCRVVGDSPNLFLSCNLARASGFDSNQYTFQSIHGIDLGYAALPRFLGDVNGDGRADYCRFVGDAPYIFLSCNLAGATEFDRNQYGASILDVGAPKDPASGFATWMKGRRDILQ